MTDTARLIAQAREPLTPREAEELCDRLAEALEAAEAELAKRPRPTLDGQLVADNASLNARLEAAEAETKETWLSLHARAVKAEEALGAAEAERDELAKGEWRHLWQTEVDRAEKAEAALKEIAALSGNATTVAQAATLIAVRALHGSDDD